MGDLLTTRTRLCSNATKLCNDLRSYREGDRKALDPDQLALKLHHVEKLQVELQGIQDQLDKFVRRMTAATVRLWRTRYFSVLAS